jgi:hypothetical protein
MFMWQYVSTIVPASSLGLTKLSKFFGLNKFTIFVSNKQIYSYVAIYLTSVSIYCTLALILQVTILNLHNRDLTIEREMSKWVNFY